jgi:hypothetical protein
MIKKLIKIQAELIAPKAKFNSFGKYKYRSCEDILEALRIPLEKYDAAVILTDEIVLIGERYYIKATAKLICEEGIAESTAFAREPEIKKGMDDSQMTGAASSYARKYALNGLFAIDDTKDADEHEVGETKPTQKTTTEKKNNELISDRQAARFYSIAKGRDTKTIAAMLKAKGYGKAKEIKWQDYNDLISAVEKLPKEVK